MFIWKSNAKRCNPYAPYKDEQGTQYVRVPQELYEEIPDPLRGDDNLNYNQEINEAPYLICTPKSPEQLERLQDDKNLNEANRHLSATDYLFHKDRHDVLLTEEPQREADIRNSRELARQVIRAHRVKYPDAR